MTADVKVQLSYEQTVPRELAHRRAIGEVFITDSAQAGEDEYALAVQIPRAHMLWSDRRPDYHDPFASGEAARQGSFVVIHRHLGIPVGLPFSMRTFEFAVESLNGYQDDQRAPLDGVLHYRLSDKRVSGGQLGSMRIDGEMTINGVLAMRFGGDVVFMSGADYQALRAFQRSRKPIGSGTVPDPVTPLAPGAVGRADGRNVAIGHPLDAAGPRRFPLVIDLSHPSFFDHGYDHVPGPLCVEAFRQAAIVVAHESSAIPSPVVAMTGCRVAFADFGEYEQNLFCSAELMSHAAGGPVRLRVGLHQFGSELVTGYVELTPYP
jgi:hypothetical protein